jgi:hypothetical protein
LTCSMWAIVDSKDTLDDSDLEPVELGGLSAPRPSVTDDWKFRAFYVNIRMVYIWRKTRLPANLDQQVSLALVQAFSRDSLICWTKDRNYWLSM